MTSEVPGLGLKLTGRLTAPGPGLPVLTTGCGFYSDKLWNVLKCVSVAMDGSCVFLESFCHCIKTHAFQPGSTAWPCTASGIIKLTQSSLGQSRGWFSHLF